MALSYILRKYDKIVPNFLATDMYFLSFIITRKCQGCNISLGNFLKIKSDKRRAEHNNRSNQYFSVKTLQQAKRKYFPVHISYTLALSIVDEIEIGISNNNNRRK